MAEQTLFSKNLDKKNREHKKEGRKVEENKNKVKGLL
jgi:hypothetical protein